MDPIIYRKGDFPIELSRSRSYVDFSAGWSVDKRKFCVREGRSSGWRYNVTTRGAYDTFAEAYAAAEKAARDLAAGRKEYNDVCLLDREDNKKNLVGSWGLSRAQSEELTSPPEESRRMGRVFRAALQHSFYETMAHTSPEVFLSAKRSFLASIIGADGQEPKPSLDDTLRSAATRQAEGANVSKTPDHNQEEKGRS